MSQIGYRAHLLLVLAIAVFVTALMMPRIDAPAYASKHVDHYTIALVVRSLIEEDGQLSPGVQAIVDFANERVEKINRPHGKVAGGINGVPVRLKIINDEADENKTISLVNDVLKDPNLIALYGLISPTSGHQVIKAVGKHGVPFISEISDDSLFSDYPNIFTMQTSASDDIRAYSQFVLDNYRSTIFIGGIDSSNTQRFHDALGPISDKVDLLSAHWLPAKSDQMYDNAASAAIKEIKKLKPEIISLSADILRNSDILKRLAAAGLDIPVFFLNGRIDYAKNSLRGDIYFGDLFEFDGMTPNVVSGRMASIRRKPGFNRLNALNKNHASRALSYLDVLSWIKEASEGAKKNLAPSAMRSHIASKLLGYHPSRRVFQGVSRDWSFTDNKSRDQFTLIKWWKKGSDKAVVWKIQYKPVGKDVMQIPVAFISLDMVRIVGVDSNTKSFNAEFYASVASHQNVGLSRFEFSNAMLSEDDGKPLVHSRLIDGSPPAVGSGGKRRLYKVAGRFRFEPDLSRYPFDQQPFSISMQARDATLPVFIQPPPAGLRDSNISIEGWTLLEGKQNNYIGFERNTVTLADKHVSDQEVVHFYNYSFTWVAERLSLNYYLRVIIPLGLIVIVAYASIFMPNTRIESVVAIQVTALLSTIALYFSIPKFDTETATLSDKIFVFTEAMIVLMIVTSIFRVGVSTGKTLIPTGVVMVLQIIFVPIFCYLMLRYITIINLNTGAVFAGKSISDFFYMLIGFV